MFGIEQISRRCLMTFSDGSKIQATIYIPKPTKPIFPEQMNSKSPIKINSNSVLSDEYEIGRIQYTIQNKIHRSNIAADLYRLNGKFSSFVDNESSYWFVSKTLQNILMRTFAIAHNHNIDLMEHIKLKMQYNESRPYLHGCKY